MQNLKCKTIRLLTDLRPSNFKAAGQAVLFLFLCLAASMFSSCKVSYGLNDKTSIPDSVKTVKINFIENRAPYQNPQLSPALTERLRQKIINQTKLANTNNENAHWELSGEVRDYSISTTGVTSANGRQQSSINRLTVTVHITLNKRIDNKVEEFDVSRSFDFPAQQSLQAAEAALLTEMIKNLSDEIFNKLFSDW